MGSKKINGYWIRSNDDGTYSIDIEYMEYTVTFNRARIEFSCGENMAFPITIETLDENDNHINSYSLIPNNKQD